MNYSELRVYGESFMCHWSQGLKGWTHKLSKKLQTKEVNRAVSGSSVESSLKRLWEDMNQNKIKENSAIIFLFTTPGRFYNKSILERYPGAGTLLVHEHLLHGWVQNYYEKNKSHIKWWLVEQDPDLEHMRFNCYIQGLSHWLPKKFPTVDFYFIFNTIGYNPFDFTGMNSLPKNSHVITKIELNKINSGEIDCNADYKYSEFVKYTETDPRVNHLTEHNQKILVDQFYNYIQTKNIKSFKKSEYLKNIIKPIENIEMYDYYVENNYLPRKLDQIQERLSNE